MQKLPEKILHHIWKMKLIKPNNLKTNNAQQPIQLINIGEHNTNTGPDFLNAQIRIGDILWAGHVEIHWKSSDWNRHRHAENPHYDNVILHIVYEDDQPVKNKQGEYIPTLTIKGRVDT